MHTVKFPGKLLPDHFPWTLSVCFFHLYFFFVHSSTVGASWMCLLQFAQTAMMTACLRMVYTLFSFGFVFESIITINAALRSFNTFTRYMHATFILLFYSPLVVSSFFCFFYSGVFRMRIAYSMLMPWRRHYLFCWWRNVKSYLVLLPSASHGYQHFCHWADTVYKKKGFYLSSATTSQIICKCKDGIFRP